jgi:transcriptional regulator with XRE-family HTH domain
MHTFNHTSTCLLKFRLENDLTQTALAKYLGCNPQFISNWERGLCLPPMGSVKIMKNKFRNFDSEKFIECASRDYAIKYTNKMKKALK